MAKSMTHPAARKKKGVQSTHIAERRKRVWELRKNGNSYQDIADKIGVSKPTVQQDLMATLKELKEETREEAESYRTIQVERLEDLLKTHRPIAMDASEEEYLQATDKVLKIEHQLAKLMGTEELPVQRTEEIGDGVSKIQLDFSGIPGLKESEPDKPDG